MRVFGETVASHECMLDSKNDLDEFKLCPDMSGGGGSYNDKEEDKLIQSKHYISRVLKFGGIPGDSRPLTEEEKMQKKKQMSVTDLEKGFGRDLTEQELRKEKILIKRECDLDEIEDYKSKLSDIEMKIEDLVQAKHRERKRARYESQKPSKKRKVDAVGGELAADPVGSEDSVVPSIDRVEAADPVSSVDGMVPSSVDVVTADAQGSADDGAGGGVTTLSKIYNASSFGAPLETALKDIQSRMADLENSQIELTNNLSALQQRKQEGIKNMQNVTKRLAAPEAAARTVPRIRPQIATTKTQKREVEKTNSAVQVDTTRTMDKLKAIVAELKKLTKEEGALQKQIDLMTGDDAINKADDIFEKLHGGDDVVTKACFRNAVADPDVNKFLDLPSVIHQEDGSRDLMEGVFQTISGNEKTFTKDKFDHWVRNRMIVG